MRLIDADTLKRAFAKEFDLDNLFGVGMDYISIMQEINESPTIDAIPVVRCRDCKYSTYYYKCTCPHWDSDQYIYPEVDEEGFTKFQLWELMSIYGPHLRMGCNVPFEDCAIYIRGGDLEEVSLTPTWDSLSKYDKCLLRDILWERI